MKRKLAGVLCLVFCLALVGCSAQDGSITFYYLNSEYTYGSEDAVIAPEIREEPASKSLEYLLRLYLDGPLTDDYISPFPRGTQLVSLENADGILRITLSEEFGTLDGLDFTLAAASLARTCFALTEVDQIEIAAVSPEEVRITLSRDSLVLLDDSATETTEEQEN